MATIYPETDPYKNPNYVNPAGVRTGVDISKFPAIGLNHVSLPTIINIGDYRPKIVTYGGMGGVNLPCFFNKGCSARYLWGITYKAAFWNTTIPESELKHDKTLLTNVNKTSKYKTSKPYTRRANDTDTQMALDLANRRLLAIYAWVGGVQAPPPDFPSPVHKMNAQTGYIWLGRQICQQVSGGLLGWVDETMGPSCYSAPAKTPLNNGNKTSIDTETGADWNYLYSNPCFTSHYPCPTVMNQQLYEETPSLGANVSNANKTQTTEGREHKAKFNGLGGIELSLPQ